MNKVTANLALAMMRLDDATAAAVKRGEYKTAQSIDTIKRLCVDMAKVIEREEMKHERFETGRSGKVVIVVS